MNNINPEILWRLNLIAYRKGVKLPELLDQVLEEYVNRFNRPNDDDSTSVYTHSKEI